MVTYQLAAVDDEHAKGDHRLGLGNTLTKVVEDFNGLPAIRACMRYVNGNSKNDTLFTAAKISTEEAKKQEEIEKKKDLIYILLALDERPNSEDDFGEKREDMQTCLAEYQVTHPPDKIPHSDAYIRAEYSYIREQIIKYNNILDIASHGVQLERFKPMVDDGEKAPWCNPADSPKKERDPTNDIDREAIGELSSMFRYPESIILVDKWFVRLTNRNYEKIQDEFSICEIVMYHRNCNQCGKPRQP